MVIHGYEQTMQTATWFTWTLTTCSLLGLESKYFDEFHNGQGHTLYEDVPTTTNQSFYLFFHWDCLGERTTSYNHNTTTALKGLVSLHAVLFRPVCIKMVIHERSIFNFPPFAWAYSVKHGNMAKTHAYKHLFMSFSFSSSPIDPFYSQTAWWAARATLFRSIEKAVQSRRTLWCLHWCAHPFHSKRSNGWCCQWKQARSSKRANASIARCGAVCALLRTKESLSALLRWKATAHTLFGGTDCCSAQRFKCIQLGRQQFAECERTCRWRRHGPCALE